MILFKKAFTGVFILFSICMFIIINSKAEASEGFKKDQIAGTKYICYTKEAIMKLSFYDIDNKIESIATARALVSAGLCEYYPQGLLIKVREVIHEYIDYNKFVVQVLSCVNPKSIKEDSPIVYTAAYKQLATDLPFFDKDGKEEKLEELKV